MPLLGFKKEFVGPIESGKKRHTIRAPRKYGRNPKPGQILYLYVGLRTKSCRKLKEVICKSCETISIEENHDIYIGIHSLNEKEKEKLAIDDGFENLNNFYDFFIEMHGLPFYGFLIKW